MNLDKLTTAARYTSIVLVAFAIGVVAGRRSDEVRIVPTTSVHVGSSPTGGVPQSAVVRGYLTSGEVSDVMGVTQREITRRIKSGEITAEKVESRWRIPLDYFSKLASKKEIGYQNAN